MQNVAEFENSNALKVMYSSTPPNSPDRPLHIPLDAMKSVWSGGEGDWCILLAYGFIERTSEEWWAFFP